MPIGDGNFAFVANSLPPKKCQLTSVVWQEQENALMALGELRAIVPYLPNPELFTSPFLRREAVLSSKIEGTNTEIQQLYLFEVEKAGARAMRKEKVASESQSDAREVLNYVEALEHGLGALETLPICVRVIREMHRILMTGVATHRGRYKAPGDFRTTQAYIGSKDIRTARFVAAPAEKINGLIGDLERFINAKSDLPTLVRIALTHYQFEAIHPFADGNGRLGRLLIALQLAAHDILPAPLLYLSAYFEANRKEYNNRLFKVSQQGAWEDWIIFFLKGVHAVANDAVQRAHRLLKLRDEFRTKLRTASGMTLILVDHLLSRPVITVNDAKKITDLSYVGAKQNVDKLVDAGLLFSTPERRRNKAYYAKPILELLE